MKVAVQQEQPVQFRVIVVGIVQNESGEYDLQDAEGRGVFPDQWGLPGGGIEEGEMMEAAPRRELREELGTEIFEIKPLFFTDGRIKSRSLMALSAGLHDISDLFLQDTSNDLGWLRIQ